MRLTKESPKYREVTQVGHCDARSQSEHFKPTSKCWMLVESLYRVLNKTFMSSPSSAARKPARSLK